MALIFSSFAFTLLLLIQRATTSVNNHTYKNFNFKIWMKTSFENAKIKDILISLSDKTLN